MRSEMKVVLILMLMSVSGAVFAQEAEVSDAEALAAHFNEIPKSKRVKPATSTKLKKGKKKGGQEFGQGPIPKIPWT